MILNLNDEVVSDFLGWLIGYQVDVRTADETRTTFAAGSSDDGTGRWGMACQGWYPYGEKSEADEAVSFIIPWDDIEEIEVL